MKDKNRLGDDEVLENPTEYLNTGEVENKPPEWALEKDAVKIKVEEDWGEENVVIYYSSEELEEFLKEEFRTCYEDGDIDRSEFEAEVERVSRHEFVRHDFERFYWSQRQIGLEESV